MKTSKHLKIPLLILGLMIFISLGLGTVSAASTSNNNSTMYISTTGNDTWDGQSATYNSTTGSGPKATIENATSTVTDGGSVYIADGIYNESDITINKNMNIIGESQTGTIINGQKSGYSIFSITSGVTVTITNLTLTNGYVNSDGGAIHNLGNLTIENCIFTNNSIDGSNVGGGAVYNFGNLIVNNSTFTNDTSGIYGGAICNDVGANLTVNNSTFTDNMALLGGAIENFGNSTINNNTFTNNTGDWAGGAIFSQGIGTTIIGNTFLYNKVNPDYGRGGAVFNNGDNGSVTVHFNRIIGNDLGEVAGTLTDATLNWWGNNTDPSSLVESSVNVTPWLVLNISTNSSSVNNGKNVTITVDLQHDSTGTYHDPIREGHVPDVTVTLTGSNGTIPSTTLVNGLTMPVFTANNSGVANITATVDNQTVYTLLTVNPSTYLYLNVTTSKSNPHVGDTSVITYKLSNSGPDTANNVTVTFKIPDGLNFVTATVDSGNWTYNSTTRMLTWTLDNVPVGDPYLNITVTPLSTGSYTITSTITSLTANQNTNLLPSITINAQTPNNNNPTGNNSTGNNTGNTVHAATQTIAMQHTGVPLAGLALAILTIFSGILPRRKQ